LLKKVLFVILSILIIMPCGFALVYSLNLAVSGGLPQRMPSDYEATEYALVLGNREIRLTVYDNTTLVGWFNDDGVIINVSVKYENYGTAYEHYTAKIYNSDTNEYIDYVKIECDGKKIKLTSKTENLDFYDPANILDNIKKDNSIFTLLDTNHIVLNAITE